MAKVTEAEEKEAYLEGRWEIGGRRLRYEAGTDIGLAVLRILQEFAIDIESPYFICDHDYHGTHERVLALIARGWQIERGEDLGDSDSLHAWKAWLHSVAEILPFLWD